MAIRKATHDASLCIAQVNALAATNRRELYIVQNVLLVLGNVPYLTYPVQDYPAATRSVNAGSHRAEFLT